jgi:hypothetical protein
VRGSLGTARTTRCRTTRRAGGRVHERPSVRRVPPRGRRGAPSPASLRVLFEHVEGTRPLGRRHLNRCRRMRGDPGLRRAGRGCDGRGHAIADGAGSATCGVRGAPVHGH